MRVTHYGKPFLAVCGTERPCYSVSMQTNSRSTRSTRLTLTLRLASAAVLLTVLGTWIGTGAHLGWTQTSKVTTQHDEITGIDYPVREKTFVAGVEILGAGLATAAALAGASVLASRRQSATRA